MSRFRQSAYWSEVILLLLSPLPLSGAGSAPPVFNIADYGAKHDASVPATDAFRRGGTHIGQNPGKMDLWVIAVEPK